MGGLQGLHLPDGVAIIPGVIDSTTHFIEHPELVAQRIVRYAEVVGRRTSSRAQTAASAPSCAQNRPSTRASRGPSSSRWPTAQRSPQSDFGISGNFARVNQAFGPIKRECCVAHPDSGTELEAHPKGLLSPVITCLSDPTTHDRVLQALDVVSYYAAHLIVTVFVAAFPEASLHSTVIVYTRLFP